MFITGIFSTHIPYIVLGLFYFFLMSAGISEPAHEENQAGEEGFGVWFYETSICQPCDTFTYHAGVLCADTANDVEQLIIQQKIKYQCVESVTTGNSYLSHSLFNRPPPVV